MSDEVKREIQLAGERLLSIYENHEAEVEGFRATAAVVVFLGEQCFIQWIGCSQESAGEFVRELMRTPGKKISEERTQ